MTRCTPHIVVGLVGTALLILCIGSGWAAELEGQVRAPADTVIPHAEPDTASSVAPPPSGGAWRLAAEVEAAGAMTTHGEWQGTFRLVEGDRVHGGGTLVTTVTGTCVSGVSRAPLVISGHRAGDILHVQLTGDPEFAETEPDVAVEETLECAVRTLVELPSLLNGMAELVQRMLKAERACPLEVPVAAPATTVECGGVTFRVTRSEGN